MINVWIILRRYSSESEVKTRSSCYEIESIFLSKKDSFMKSNWSKHKASIWTDAL